MSPVRAYFGGHGEKVAADMKKRHGSRWREVFYATAAKQDQNPGDKKKALHAALKKGSK